MSATRQLHDAAHQLADAALWLRKWLGVARWFIPSACLANFDEACDEYAKVRKP